MSPRRRRPTVRRSFTHLPNRARQAPWLKHPFSSGSAFARFSWLTPINALGTKFGFAASFLKYQLGTDLFDPMDAEGTAAALSLQLLHPQIRSRNHNLFVQASLDTRRFEDQVHSIGLDSRKDIPLYGTLGLVGDFRDTFGGVGPLSYAGYWHPWVSVATATAPSAGTQSVLRDVPPDGAVAGMIAARELARGAWIAPAGVPLSGVVRLTAGLTAAEQTRLFDAHANLLVHQPGAFTALSAHTLTGNRDQLQVSVRRLLILLRKICLLLGARYTFEINDDRFRQLVRMRFDRILAAAFPQA